MSTRASHSSPRPLIIDTDGGVDDATALWWALTDPRVELIGVTTVAGVVSAEAAAANVLRVLARAGRADIPVAVGANAPSGPAPSLRSADFIHGGDGLGNTHRPLAPGVRASEMPASELLHRLCASRPGEVSLVSLGPLTNLAYAVQQDPEWPRFTRDFVAMAGCVAVRGNALPAAEANVANDPVAAATVVAAAWPSPPLLVGLDITHAATLTDAEFALLGEHRTAAAAFLDEPLRFYRRFGSTFTAPNCPCHDLLAVMACVEPALIIEAPVLPLAVVTQEGPAWGATVADFRAPLFAHLGGSEQSRPEGFHDWRIGLKVDVDRFRFLVRAMFGASDAAAPNARLTTRAAGRTPC